MPAIGLIRSALVLGVLALAFAAPASAQQGEDGAGEGEGGPYWAGPGISGSWYDPARSGEGFVVQMLPDGGVFAIWFTYPATGEPGQQAWLLATGGRIDADTITFESVLRPQGTRFGEGFDPAEIEYRQWGTLQFHVQDCAHMSASWSGPEGYGSGTLELTRLTVLDELDCSGARELTATGARALEGLRVRSGAWYVPSRSGEGWMAEELADGALAIYWFTFDPDGNQAWTIGVGTPQEDGAYLVEQALIAGGARFGADFRREDVVLSPWGTQRFHFATCNGLQMAYASELPGYGAAAREGARLTTLAGAPCIDGTPTAPQATAWRELAALPGSPQSELAATVLDGRLYALGGFGDPRGFKRYDRSVDAWTVLPQLPAGRHHLAAFAIDGGVYMVGGAPTGGGDQSRAAYRFDPTAGAWEPIDEPQYMFASHAAVLNGRAYIGDEDGSLQEYDPRSRRVRRIESAFHAPRDHSQVVAFLGEIWMMGGRSPDHGVVSIYDPVSETWRRGPTLSQARGGFAAAVVGNRIAVAGGERAQGVMAVVVPGTETYTAGMGTWLRGPDMPVPVHGVPGASVDGRFQVVSGSIHAGLESGATGRAFELEFEP